MAGELVRCARCGADFAKAVVDGEFGGACPRCLAGLMSGDPGPAADNAAGPIPVTRSPFQRGDKVQGFEILDILGQGGMGVVYKARQSSLGRIVALKVLTPRLAGNAEFVARFEREAKILASLNHPNVVQVYDFGRASDLVAGDFLYLVMEHVDGSTLEDALQRKPADLPTLVRRIRDVARGLEAVHGAGLIHRDLKPANILLAKDGRAKISDFGLAVDGENELKVTQTGMFVGTPHYASPEHAQAKKLDGRSDLYALGVILFEGAAGRPPFQAPSATALLLKHVNEAPPPLYKLAPKTPKSLQELVRKLLAKNPASRPESADALCRDLDRVQAEFAEAPKPERILSVPAAPPARKLPMKWIAAGAAGAVALLAVLIAALSGSPPPPPRVEPPRPAPVVAKAPEPVREPEKPPPPPPVVEEKPPPPPPPAVQEPPKPENPLAGVWETAEKRFAEARALYDEGRAKESAPTLAEGAFKAEEALTKYRAILEVGSPEDQKRAGEQIKAVQQFMKLVNETRLALSKPATPAEPPPVVAPPAPAAEPPAPAPVRRSPVPDAAAVKEPEKRVREIFKREYARKTPADQAALARTLRTQAASETDPATRYVLLREARDLSAAGDDLPGALEAVDLLAAHFELDILPAKQALLSKIATPRTSDAALALASAHETLARDAVAADAYEVATSAAARADTLARAAKDEGSITRIAELKKDVAFLKEEHAKAKLGDAEAMGRFYCFCKGDWEKGLPLLAALKSPLGALAGQDLAGEAAGAVGDGWWDLAEKEKHPIRKQRLRDRARARYEEALPTLGGLDRVRVEKRLETADVAPSGVVNLLALIQPDRDTVNGRWAMKQGKLECEAEWFGRIVVPYQPPEEYDWQLTVERLRNDEDFYLGVARSDGALGVSIDAGHSSYTGLGDMTPRGEALGKFAGGLLPFQKPASVTVSVRRKSVGLSVDGKKVFAYAWKGDEGRSLMPQKWDVPRPEALFVGAHGSSFRVHAMRLTAVSGTGKVLRSSPAAPPPIALPPAAAGPGVDLLALVDPAMDAVEGTWTREGGALVSPAGEHARLQIPYVPPDEYDLRATVKRGDSADGFAFGLARGANQWTLFVDKIPGEGGHTGLELVDGGMHTGAKGLQLRPGESATFDCRVRKSGVSLLKDGKLVFQWQGATSRLSNFPRWDVPNKQALFLGHWQSAISYTELRLLPVSGAGRPLRAPAAKPAPLPRNAVDLLALVDPAKDAVKGDWTRDAQGLRCSAGDHIRLMIPYAPPDEYDVHYELERVEGGDGLVLGFSRGNTQWTAALDSHPGAGHKVGLDGGESVVTGPLFQNGRVSKVEARIRKSVVTLIVDGRTVLESKGATSRLHTPDGWKVPHPKALSLAAWGSSYRFSKVYLVPVSGSGAPIRR